MNHLLWGVVFNFSKSQIDNLRQVPHPPPAIPGRSTEEIDILHGHRTRNTHIIEQSLVRHSFKTELLHLKVNVNQL